MENTIGMNENLNTVCLLGNVVSKVNFLGMMMLLWLFKKKPLFLGDIC